VNNKYLLHNNTCKTLINSVTYSGHLIPGFPIHTRRFYTEYLHFPLQHKFALAFTRCRCFELTVPTWLATKQCRSWWRNPWNQPVSWPKLFNLVHDPPSRYLVHALVLFEVARHRNFVPHILHAPWSTTSHKDANY
jgi:hypothetical protein